MKFYAPENLDLNKLSAPLAHKVINFFVDKIKELKCCCQNSFEFYKIEKTFF